MLRPLPLKTPRHQEQPAYENPMFQHISSDILNPTMRELGDRLRTLTNRLDEVASINYDDGTATPDEALLRDAIAASAPAGLDVDRCVTELLTLARGGFAVIARPERRERGAAVPWSLLDGPSASGALPARTLAAIGRGLASPPERPHARISAPLPGAPAETLTTSRLDRFARASRAAGLQDAFAGIRRAVESLDRILTLQITEEAPHEPAADPVREAVNCLLNAEWTIHWWGISICMDQACGNRIADVLLSGGGGHIADTLKDIIANGTNIRAALQAGGKLVSLVLVLLSIYLALMLRANNTPRGVCIQANWPTPWFGLFVWAVGR